MGEVIAMKTRASVAEEMLEKLRSGQTWEDVLEWAKADKAVSSVLIREGARDIVEDMSRKMFR